MDQVVISALMEHRDGRGLVSPKRSAQFEQRHPSPFGRIGCCPRRLCRHVTVIRPDSQRKMAWDCVGMAFVIYDLYMIPAEMAFDMGYNSIIFAMSSTINFFFIVDIIISFFTAYKSPSGVLVYIPRRVAQHYLRSMFLPDALSAIPWEWLPVNNKGLHFTKLLRSLRLLRLARIMRLLRVRMLTEKVLQAFEESPGLIFSVFLMKILIFLFTLTHWTACSWYLIGCLGDRHGWGPTWISKFVDADESISMRYVHALYFALTTMTTVGYGDITPQNSTERTFTILLLLVASVVFATLMGSLTDLISTMNSERDAVVQKMQSLGRYMKWRDVPPTLSCTLKDHLHYMWEMNRDFDAYEEQLKDQLTPGLRKELCFHVYGGALRSSPFLAWMKDQEACVKELADKVMNSILATGDCMIFAGEVNKEIKIVVNGAVHVSMNQALHRLDGIKHHEPEPEEVEDRDHKDFAIRSGRFWFLPRNVEGHEHNSALAAVEMLKSLSRKGGHSSRPQSCTIERGLQDESPVSMDLVENDVEFLQLAAHEHEDHEKRLQSAACAVQRWWKRWKSRSRGRPAKRQHQISSETAVAPAYFGESCLWVPMKDWDSGVDLTYKYNVFSQSRVEVVTVPRSSIQEVLERFSPWLARDFLAFQTVVCNRLVALELELGMGPQVPSWKGPQHVSRMLPQLELEEAVSLCLAPPRLSPFENGQRSGITGTNSMRQPLLSV